MGADGRGEVSTQAVEYATPPSAPCDIVFLDPPYGTGLAEAALLRIANPAWLAPGALVSVETDSSRLAPPPRLEVEAERRFGKAYLTLFRQAN
jgi:16S rRNA (guanine966-N2)-methyltransferase